MELLKKDKGAEKRRLFQDTIKSILPDYTILKLKFKSNSSCIFSHMLVITFSLSQCQDRTIPSLTSTTECHGWIWPPFCHLWVVVGQIYSLAFHN